MTIREEHDLDPISDTLENDPDLLPHRRGAIADGRAEPCWKVVPTACAQQARQ